jgi:deoxyribose-phosphate aldolase
VKPATTASHIPQDVSAAARLIGLLDLTSLGSTDTVAEVISLAARAVLPVPSDPAIHCAAVCVWPNFAATARDALAGTPVRVACVAGAFPFSQSPLAAKTAEIAAAVADGATEIDIAINRGLFLSGRFDELSHEIATMKQACGTAHLKVILETCELPDDNSIRHACRIALEAGAGFLKTSTGKGRHGATPEHTRILLEEAAAWRAATGTTIGVKAAGGIRTAAEAITYLNLAAEYYDDVNATVFRIGASSLLDDLADRI